MKARVKETGDIVDATYQHTAGDGVKYYDIDKSGYVMMEDELDFDFSYSPDYWTRLEHQAAIAAMGGICGNTSYDESTWEEMAEDAILAAHFFVQKLKEKEERK
jgi:hypothetical protein